MLVVQAARALAVHLLPRWFHHLTLVGLFVVEIPLPFLAFIPGWPRLLTAAGTVGLMVGIMVAGCVLRWTRREGGEAGTGSCSGPKAMEDLSWRANSPRPSPSPFAAAASASSTSFPSSYAFPYSTTLQPSPL